MSRPFEVRVVIDLPFGVYGTTLSLTLEQAAQLYDRLGEVFAVDATDDPCDPQVTR